MNEEVFVTSRSHERAFARLPDLIQEAAVSAEFSSPTIRIIRAPNVRVIEPYVLNQPIFYVVSRTDSGIHLPDLEVTDEKVLAKYGLDLTANFADIKVHGSKAFFQQSNMSNHSTYSLCTCATGYIWVSVRTTVAPTNLDEFSDLEVQIGTYALKAKAITTTEIPFKYKNFGGDNAWGGQLALLFSTILGKYLRLRMMGQQYEDAAETAVTQGPEELLPRIIFFPDRFGNFESLLRQICTNAPLPPTSDEDGIFGESNQFYEDVTFYLTE